MIRTKCCIAIVWCFFASLMTAKVAAQCPVLIWSDEFDGSSLNSSNWEPQIGDGCDLGICGWGNNELQYYRSENLEVSSGTLKITAKQENFEGKDYTSSRIRSLGLADIDLTRPHLRLEARIKVPAGKGMWPAFWMMPSDMEIEKWPLGGEIDIMEFIGREPNFAQGYMHYGTRYRNKSQRGGPLRLPDSPSDDFHVYSIEKTPEKIEWFVDGHRYQGYTADDIEAKYSWPFESTFHFILNVAVGGDWPENPDETTVFPNTMEVDYVRVYDLSGGAFHGHIIGKTLVQKDQAGETYCILEGPDFDSLVWTVPDDASFTETSSTCITVDFGSSSGYVQAVAQSSCGEQTFSVPVEVHPFYEKEFSFVEPDSSSDTATFLRSTGSYSIDSVGSEPSVRYIRNLTEVWDYIMYETAAIPDASLYVSGEKKFYLEVLRTTTAPCTRVILQLEDSNSAKPENYPVGRHSRYVAYIEKLDDWQRLAFVFYDRPDISTTNVDRIALLFDSFVNRGDEYYFKNFDSAASGCTENCEPLSTNTCRTRAKSEAGACNDGVNNDGEGYDGDDPTDCEDSDCWDDPVCGTERPTEPRTGGATDLTDSPTESPTDSPTSSTGASFAFDSIYLVIFVIAGVAYL